MELSTSEDLHASADGNNSRTLKSNVNQRRVNEAMEKITNKRNKEDDTHECSSSEVPKDNGKTKEKNGGDVVEEEVCLESDTPDRTVNDVLLCY